ncbi:MAG: polysaccharide deacetylase family protein [Lunatimonas sp.]|uniref:polysaccharide deacetylase family protein n=1 Tax=Lunatimonas sp. TaxID=2060141 RepID=UPI00263BB310|nr:polysaccharide deacetylase family protein [Lunatimonas sp.]MCC5936801.1 polysaccharide deacetylase family protein [Lunatimonas sp.]
MRTKTIGILAVLGAFLALPSLAQTYAERLGYPKGAKVIIFHVDDTGMSYEANEGTILSMEQGLSTSCSIMMPCSWVPDYFDYLKDYPQVDSGVHLTLTSEWKGYRWGPVAGKPTTPTLVDPQGYLWPSVRDVVQHGDPEELYREIKAQVDKFISMGFQPTHLDSHMGTLFASEAFLKKYLQLGVEYQIPVMFPGGHATWIQQESNASNLNVEQLQAIGKMLWEAGLPVLDDLHTDSYSWKIDPSIEGDDNKIQAYKTAKFIETIQTLQPGVTQIITHATNSTPHFERISPSGSLRKGDMLAMMDPKLKEFIESEGVILTTWRELMERRKKVGY